MVILDRTSWHYKLTAYCYGKYVVEEYKANLCPYIRAIIKSMLALPMVVLWHQFPDKIRQYSAWASAIVVMVAIATSAHVILGAYYDEYQWWYVLAWVGALGGLIGIVLGIIFGAFFIKDKIDDYNNASSTPNLIKEYFVAKHSKICPRIKFVNKGDKDDTGNM